MSRLAHLVPGPLRRWWREQNRYELDVPEDVRRLAEAHGIPKPTRYVPSAQGAGISVARLREQMQEQARSQAQAEVEGWTHG